MSDTSTPAAERPGLVVLPPVTVFKVEQCSMLLERLVAEKTSVFAGAAEEYRRAWRSNSARQLEPAEVAQIAAGFAEQLGVPDAIRVVQDAGLVAHDEPPRSEILLAAGAATAPAFIDASLRFVALLELDNERVEAAAERGALDELIGETVAVMRRLPMMEARARAAAAMDHFARETGASAGEVRRLVATTLSVALSEAVRRLQLSGLSTVSAAPTEGGPVETPSTASGGETP